MSGNGSAHTSIATVGCKQYGAKVKCAPITKTTNYTCTARPPNGRMTRLSLDPVNGTGEISFTAPSAIGKFDSGETSSDACMVYPGNPMGPQQGDTREAIAAKIDRYTQELAAAQRFKFNPNDSSFSGGNSFSRSWSTGEPTKIGELSVRLGPVPLHRQRRRSQGPDRGGADPAGRLRRLAAGSRGEREGAGQFPPGRDRRPQEGRSQFAAAREGSQVHHYAGRHFQREGRGPELAIGGPTGNGPTDDYDFRIDSHSPEH